MHACRFEPQAFKPALQLVATAGPSLSRHSLVQAITVVVSLPGTPGRHSVLLALLQLLAARLQAIPAHEIAFADTRKAAASLGWCLRRLTEAADAGDASASATNSSSSGGSGDDSSLSQQAAHATASSLWQALVASQPQIAACKPRHLADLSEGLLALSRYMHTQQQGQPPSSRPCEDQEEQLRRLCQLRAALQDRVEELIQAMEGATQTAQLSQQSQFISAIRLFQAAAALRACQQLSLAGQRSGSAVPQGLEQDTAVRSPAVLMNHAQRLLISQAASARHDSGVSCWKVAGLVASLHQISWACHGNAEVVEALAPLWIRLRPNWDTETVLVLAELIQSVAPLTRAWQKTSQRLHPGSTESQAMGAQQLVPGKGQQQCSGGSTVASNAVEVHESWKRWCADRPATRRLLSTLTAHAQQHADCMNGPQWSALLRSRLALGQFHGSKQDDLLRALNRVVSRLDAPSALELLHLYGTIPQQDADVSVLLEQLASLPPGMTSCSLSTALNLAADAATAVFQEAAKAGAVHAPAIHSAVAGWNASKIQAAAQPHVAIQLLFAAQEYVRQGLGSTQGYVQLAGAGQRLWQVQHSMPHGGSLIANGGSSTNAGMSAGAMGVGQGLVGLLTAVASQVASQLRVGTKPKPIPAAQLDNNTPETAYTPSSAVAPPSPVLVADDALFQLLATFSALDPLGQLATAVTGSEAAGSAAPTTPGEQQGQEQEQQQQKQEGVQGLLAFISAQQALLQAAAAWLQAAPAQAAPSPQQLQLLMNAQSRAARPSKELQAALAAKLPPPWPLGTLDANLALPDHAATLSCWSAAGRSCGALPPGWQQQAMRLCQRPGQLADGARLVSLCLSLLPKGKQAGSKAALGRGRHAPPSMTLSEVAGRPLPVELQHPQHLAEEFLAASIQLAQHLTQLAAASSRQGSAVERLAVWQRVVQAVMQLQQHGSSGSTGAQRAAPQQPQAAAGVVQGSRAVSNARQPLAHAMQLAIHAVHAAVSARRVETTTGPAALAVLACMRPAGAANLPEWSSALSQALLATSKAAASLTPRQALQALLDMHTCLEPSPNGPATPAVQALSPLSSQPGSLGILPDDMRGIIMPLAARLAPVAALLTRDELIAVTTAVAAHAPSTMQQQPTATASGDAFATVATSSVTAEVLAAEEQTRQALLLEIQHRLPVTRTTQLNQVAMLAARLRPDGKRLMQAAAMQLAMRLQSSRLSSHRTRRLVEHMALTLSRCNVMEPSLQQLSSSMGPPR